MIAPFLKVPWLGDVKHLGEVNHHHLNRVNRVNQRQKFRIKESYLTILRLLIRGPNGVNRVNRVNRVNPLILHVYYPPLPL
jgi:hypothetical protein